MIWFCRIVGGLPLGSSPRTRGCKGLAFYIPAFLWSVTLVILQECLSSTLLYTYFMNGQDYRSPDPLRRITEFSSTMHIVSLQVTVAVVFLSTTRKYPRLVEVFDIVERVYRDHQCKASDVKVTVKLWVICTTAVTIATTAGMITPVFHNEVSSGKRKLSSASAFILALLYCSEVALLVHFTRVTQIIAKSFRMINAKIQKELISNVIERMERNSSLHNSDVTHANRTMLSKVKKLRTLMNTYWTLCDAVHQANVFYCDQLMAVMFSLFVHVTIKSYFFFLYVRVGNVFGFTYEGAWVLIDILYAAMLLNANTDVMISADEAGVLICKFMNKDLDPILKKQSFRMHIFIQFSSSWKGFSYSCLTTVQDSLLLDIFRFTTILSQLRLKNIRNRRRQLILMNKIDNLLFEAEIEEKMKFLTPDRLVLVRQ
ncbi:hypothetical protein J6590_085462 [Homalodisca vitripennis]|nr:hypothetical protein J6590_085462 [Homalodisca vitripennis]